MSGRNKVNPDHYKNAGRLPPDDLARERTKQRPASSAREWRERMKRSQASTGPFSKESDESAPDLPARGNSRTAKKSMPVRSRTTEPKQKAAVGTTRGRKTKGRTRSSR